MTIPVCRTRLCNGSSRFKNARRVLPIFLSKIPDNKKYIILIDDFLIDYIPFYGQAR